MKKLVTAIVILLLPFLSWAQCAMCRTQIVNNVSHGETSFAAGLNMGIIYLFSAPYILAGVIAFLWYRNAKNNERRRSVTSTHAR